MSEEGTVVPTDVPAPAPAEPAPEVVRSGSASFDAERRERLREWMAAPDLEVETIPSLETDPGEDIDPLLVVPDEGEPADATETPTPAGEAAQPDAIAPEPEATPAPEPVKPKGFAIKVGEDDFQIPEGLTFSYKADGAERTRSLEDVIRFAQLGENYDRRSRDLAATQRQMEQEYQQNLTQAQEQLQAAWSDFMDLTQKFLDDEEFREEYLEEYERLRENPDEVQTRLKAQNHDKLAAQIEAQNKAQAEAWNRQVWETVDTILTENLGDYEEDVRSHVAGKVRERFYQDYSQHGRAALSEAHLHALIAEERGVIDRAVAKARADIEAQLVPLRQQVAASVQQQNERTDQSLNRTKQAQIAPSHAPPAPPVPAARPIKSMNDARKALDAWSKT